MAGKTKNKAPGPARVSDSSGTSVICPSCGNKVPLGVLGRKRFNINFKNVCKALQGCLRKDGRPNYSAAAKWLELEAGKEVSPAFVWMRVSREAEARGVSREELLRKVLKAGGRND